MRELLNCGYCGRFVSWADYDAYAPWGGGGDQEPPDDVILCLKHSTEIYERSLARFLSEGIPPYDKRPYWQPPNCWLRARRVARGILRRTDRPVRHERVRYETSGTTLVKYCQCGRPEKHPAHDTNEAWRVGVTWCQFEYRVGKNVGTFRVQEWCACGWTTGRVPYSSEYPKLVDYLLPGTLIGEHIRSCTPGAGEKEEYFLF